MTSLGDTLTRFEVPKNIPFYDPTEDEERERQYRFKERLRYSGIPSRFHSAELDGCPEEVREWAQELKAGTCRTFLLLQGNVGSGKTYAACAAMLHAIMETTCKFTTFDKILRSITATFNGEETEEAVVNRLSNVGVLCIDDFGKSKPTEFAMSRLFEIVNNRWSNEKPTIITTQYQGQALIDRLTVDGETDTAEAIVSRLMQAKKCKFAGEDRRFQ